MKRPSILVVTRRTIRKNKYIDYVGEFHLALLVKLELLPVMVPVVEGASACLSEYMADMRGLLLVEGEDVEPEHYKARRENIEYLEKTHPLKDEIEIKLLTGNRPVRHDRTAGIPHRPRRDPRHQQRR